MALHMLVLLPLLTVLGYILALEIRFFDPIARLDAYGLTTFTYALGVSAFWMVPRVLELSLDSYRYEIAKFLTCILAGALIRNGARRADAIVQIFFLGNFCAMAAIVGMLYQDQPQQLCNAYTLDDQSTAGIGLVAMACLVALYWCLINYANYFSKEQDLTHLSAQANTNEGLK